MALPKSVQRNIELMSASLAATSAGAEGRRGDALKIVDDATLQLIGERLEDLVHLDVAAIEERIPDRWRLRAFGMLLVLTADQLAPLGDTMEAARREALALRVMLRALQLVPDDPALVDAVEQLARKVSPTSLDAGAQQLLAESVSGRGNGEQKLKVITLDARPAKKPRRT